MTLEEIRKEIDEIDLKLIELINKRLVLASKTTSYKTEVLDEEREKAISTRLEEQTRNLPFGQGTKEIFKAILSESRKIQG